MDVRQSVNSLLEKISDILRTLVSWAQNKWFLMSKPQKLATGMIGGAGASLVSWLLWHRVTNKMKKFSGYTTSVEALNGMDLSGKVAIVTGSNAGIGKQTVKTLYDHGCDVIMACRNMDKADKARLDIINSTDASTGSIVTMEMDLSSLQSVRDFAVDFTKMNKSVDYLICNAGIAALNEFETSKDGYEMQWAVNHMGHQYLTQLLMPKLIEGKSRVISVASRAHGWCTDNEYELFLVNGLKSKSGPTKETYDKFTNYAISKCSNILFARELQRRFSDKGVIAVSLNPGVIRTGIKDHVTIDWARIKIMLSSLNPRVYMREMKNVSQGAATTLRCVSLNRNEIKGGHFYVNCESGNNAGLLKGAAVVRKYADYERDSKEARLWALTEMLIKQKGFPLKLVELEK